MEQGLFSVNRICKLCGIAKITFANYRHQDDRFVAKYQWIKTKLQQIIKDNSAYGIRRIKKALFDECNIHIGRDALILSYSAPGTPTENPGQESFFGRFKDENRDEISEIKNFKELEKFIKKRIDYYNKKRIHTSAGYETPLKFTNQFINSLSLTESKKRFRFYRT